jgi:hypothetical protein
MYQNLQSHCLRSSSGPDGHRPLKRIDAKRGLFKGICTNRFMGKLIIFKIKVFFIAMMSVEKTKAGQVN